MTGASRAACLVAAALAATVPVHAQTAAVQPSVVVTGQAMAEIVPDGATLTVGVEAEAATAAASAAEVARRAQGLVDLIKAEGIPAADLFTGTASLSPLYPASNPSGAPQVPRAYRSETSLTLAVHPAERAGVLASRLIGAGASTLEGIAFTASDQPQRLDALRAAAVRDARHKAEVYAAALDLHLGAVLEVTPEGEPTPFAPRAKMMRAQAADLPVEAGTLTLRTAVTVRWQLSP